jgi:hypothetical protein
MLILTLALCGCMRFSRQASASSSLKITAAKEISLEENSINRDRSCDGRKHCWDAIDVSGEIVGKSGLTVLAGRLRVIETSDDLQCESSWRSWPSDWIGIVANDRSSVGCKVQCSSNFGSIFSCKQNGSWKVGLYRVFFSQIALSFLIRDGIYSIVVCYGACLESGSDIPGWRSADVLNLAVSSPKCNSAA